MLGFITRRDHRLMHRANNWFAPKWVRLWAMAATRAGDGWLWAFVGLAVLLLGDDNRFAALGAGGLAGLASILTFMVIKRMTGRRRPCELQPHCWATLMPPDRFSFPSGHTMTAFAIITSTCLFYPTLTPGLLFCALSIATSRILLGMHFLSDVAVGIILGCGLGYFAHFVFA